MQLAVHAVKLILEKKMRIYLNYHLQTDLIVVNLCFSVDALLDIYGFQLQGSGNSMCSVNELQWDYEFTAAVIILVSIKLTVY